MLEFSKSYVAYSAMLSVTGEEKENTQYIWFPIEHSATDLISLSTILKRIKNESEYWKEKAIFWLLKS